SFIESLRDADLSHLPKPRQSVVAEHFCRMRTIRRKRTIINLPARIVEHRGKIECTSIVGRVASTVTVGRIGVGQAGIVSAQLAVGIADGAKPTRASLLG